MKNITVLRLHNTGGLLIFKSECVSIILLRKSIQEEDYISSKGDCHWKG